MRQLIRVSAAIAVGLIMSLAFVGSAGAQGYGDDPPLTYVVGEGVVDFDGKFTTSYTAPDEIAETYLIYVVGTDADGEPFEWIAAQVSPGFAGLTWRLQGANMLPGSSYKLEARYNDGTAVSPEEIAAAANAPAEEETVDEASDDEPADEEEPEDAVEVLGTVQTNDDDGGSGATGALVGGGILLTVLAGAGLYGLRMRNRLS